MERSLPLLVDAWREVGRRAGVQQTLDALAPRIAPELTADAIRVRALDHARLALDTLGYVGKRPDALRDAFEAAAWERLLAWGRTGELLHGGTGAIRKRLGPVVPAGERGDFLVGPLLGEGRLLGVAILAARDRRGFMRVHEQRARALLEPLAAALANDQRLHDLQALREAAEADRRALLSRLGRRDIGEVLVGAEGGLAPVMERVALVADSDVPVLLLGETGSGKEVVARALRSRSRRAPQPFVRVNCGAIPPGLIDSELFGHERGSFSGATAQRRGFFERADGGTLFLDEVGELPTEAQVRLLRVLQDGSFERVGGEQSLHVDVRVIAATHRNLRAMVEAHSFREDLWYRLAVFPIEIPALRDRVEDIPALATHFALRACERFGSRPLVPSQNDLERLAAYDWPGNVRELAAVIDRAVILGGGEQLDFARALGVAVTRGSSSSAEPAVPGAAPDRGESAGPMLSLERAMARHIERALALCQGRIEGPDGAARVLEINPHTLRARMRKLGVDWRRFRRGSREAGGSS